MFANGDTQKSKPNIFDNLPALAAPNATDLRNELQRYLSMDVEHVEDVLAWWYERRASFPRLSRMARNYLSIPGRFANSFHKLYYLFIHWTTATSVDVERTFSRGRLILSHVRSRLSAESTRALVCLGSWSCLGMVRDDDVKAITLMPEVQGDEEAALDNGWDSIKI